MMFTGEPVTSEYALSIGLVNEVVPADALQAHVLAFAEKLANRSAPAMAAIKQLVYQGMELPLAAALRVERAALPEILGSADYAEGLAAFAERRPPKFTGIVE
jgi:enoyl-CoA hydratase/carnithine racemase